MGRTVLIHHGIKGQEWGKKNGPPYPLDYEDHSSEEKKLNSKSTIDGQPENQKLSKKEKKKLKKEEKKAKKEEKERNERLKELSKNVNKTEKIITRIEKADEKHISRRQKRLARKKARQERAIQRVLAMKYSEIPTDELRKVVNHKRLEVDYDDLKEREVERGHKYARDVLKTVGTIATTTGIALGVMYKYNLGPFKDSGGGS